jgi:hypothetical protein
MEPAGSNSAGFLGALANEQGFAMLGNLKNVRPELKPD